MTGAGRALYLDTLGGMTDAAWAFEDGRLIEVNGPFRLLLGMPDAGPELMGTEWWPWALQLARSARDTAATTRLLERMRRDGAAARDVAFEDGRIVEIEHAPVALADGAEGHVWRVRDVTVARTHVAALREAVASAEKANDTRRAFLAGLSHELRTPANAIIGMSELVGETTLSGDVRHLVAGIERNARRLLGLIERLLAFAGEGARADSLTPSPFSPVELVDQVASGHAGDAGPMLLCRRGPDVPRRVVGDRSGIEGLLRHLLAFALDVSEGAVEVGVERAFDGGQPAEKARLRFFVRDGVDRRDQPEPEAVLDRVFWRSTAGGEEAGVGRQIVYGLVQRIGGTLDIRPSARGTLYELRCPVEVEVGPDRSEPLAGRRILVADPHPERRVLHAEQCLEWGAAIRTAADAEAVRARLDRHEVDLALVADPLEIDRPGVPWIRIAAPDRLDLDAPNCVWRLGPTPQRAELLAAFRRCMAAEPEPQPGPAHVLVVEDLPDNATVVRRFLEHAGHRVRVVTDGAQALQAVRADAWDIVLMDINLPDMDGIEVTRRLRAFEARARLGRTPAIALTAYTTDSVRARATAAGLLAFLTKPVDRRMLAEAIARHGRRGPVGLIVDSDPVGRLLLMRRGRRRASLRLRWAADGASARAMVEDEPVAFALVDSALSDGEGLPLVREFVARGIRCALVIDRDDRDQRAAAVDAGCLGVLVKPVAADAVSRVLARLCQDTGALAPIRPRTPRAAASTGTDGPKPASEPGSDDRPQ